MGKIVATYLVKVTLRERQGNLAPSADDKAEPPTIAQIEQLIADDLDSWNDHLSATATAERTDI